MKRFLSDLIDAELIQFEAINYGEQCLHGGSLI